MNRNEKNLQTRQKIMDSAFEEFSEKNYGEASLNTICGMGNISKGIIYHYFKDKDELYLACVKECFDVLTNYLKNIMTVEDYFDARIAFFGDHPHYLGVFCSAVINPPVHLLLEIEEITAGFNEQSVSILTTLLQKMKLRSDVTLQEVVQVFREYQDFVNTRFQLQTYGQSTLKEHEERCHRSLKILLYGVVDRKEEQ